MLTDTVMLAVTDKSGLINVTDPVSSQLVAIESAITSAFPYPSSSIFHPGVRVPPNWSFSVGLQTFTFTAPSRVFYSASMMDGTPLPPWLTFNPNTVTFDGVTPLLNPGVPGLYQIVLSGSDVFGYTDVQQSFNITIASHDFELAQPAATLNLTSGYPLNTTLDVLSSFILDGNPLHAEQVANMTLGTSDLSWLTYDPSNMSLFGVPPNDQGSISIPLSITDKFGDALNTTVALAFFPSFFSTDTLSPALANPGQTFNISLNQYFARNVSDGVNLTATFDPQKAGSWLSFYTSNDTLQGMIPGDIDYDSVTVYFRAQDLVTHAWSHAEMMVSLTPNGTTNANHTPHHGLSIGTKVGLASVGAIVGGLVFLCLILTGCRRRVAMHKHKIDADADRDMDVEKWAIETPAMEYAEKMGEPDSIQMLVGQAETDLLDSLPRLTSGMSSKRGFIRNPFTRRKIPPKISNPIIMPSFSNAAFQAQLAAAVDRAGIVKYPYADAVTENTDLESMESTGDGVRSRPSGRSVTDESQDNGHSSRASWESEPPFVWTSADTKHQSQDLENFAVTSEDTHNSSIVVDPNTPVQRSEFRPSPPQAGIVLASSNTTDEGISIDNIHFPTDSDIAHTEASSDHEAIITTASRIDARRTLDSPVSSASPASSHTEKASIHRGPSPVMTTHSRLVSFGKQRTVTVSNGGARSVSQTAVVGSTSTQSPSFTIGSTGHGPKTTTLARPPAALTHPDSRSRSPSPPISLPSLPALPTLPSAMSARIAPVSITAHRILLGVAEPFHFYPPLAISPSITTSQSSSTASTGPSSVVFGAEYLALIEQDGETLRILPEWLHFEDMELWGVPGKADRGVWDVRIVERVNGLADKVVGRFALEVS